MECVELNEIGGYFALGHSLVEFLLGGRSGFFVVLLLKLCGLGLDIWALSVSMPQMIGLTMNYNSDISKSDDPKDEEKWAGFIINFLSCTYIIFQRLLFVGYIIFKSILYCVNACKDTQGKKNDRAVNSMQISHVTHTDHDHHNTNQLQIKPPVKVPQASRDDIAIELEMQNQTSGNYNNANARVRVGKGCEDCDCFNLSYCACGDIDQHEKYSLKYNTYFGSIWNSADFISKLFTTKNDQCTIKVFVYFVLYGVILGADWFLYISISAYTLTYAKEGYMTNEEVFVSLWVLLSGFVGYWEHCSLLGFYAPKHQLQKCSQCILSVATFGGCCLCCVLMTFTIYFVFAVIYGAVVYVL